MSTQEKLKKLYEVKNILSAITRMIVENMFDDQQSQLSDADVLYVEEIYELYRKWEES